MWKIEIETTGYKQVNVYAKIYREAGAPEPDHKVKSDSKQKYIWFGVFEAALSGMKRQYSSRVYLCRCCFGKRVSESHNSHMNRFPKTTGNYMMEPS
jgi:hypothetical protein